MSSSIFFVATVLLLCSNSASAAKPLVDWWETASLYQIYPRSFMDSDNDGVGDLNGITSRLHHLKEIGITAAWLSPIFESPMADMGYDVANFTNIDPLFGTLHDFDIMIKRAHKLGLKIILDFVPNHSSDEHEWFQKSIRREDGYDDFYVWADGKIDPETGKRIPPCNWQSVFGGSSWAWNEQRQQYYLHQFLDKQPDLNMTNPKVRQHLIDVFKFWLDRGVDGFRIDAVPFFVEKRFANGTYPDQANGSTICTQSQPENLEILYEWRDFLDKYQQKNGGDTRAMIGEAYSPMEYLSLAVSNGTRNGLQLPMNFGFVALGPYLDPNAASIQRLADGWMNIMWAKHKQANWVAGNHDNGRIASRMGETRVDLMTMVVHAMPGTSVTYYGEEIGMCDGIVDRNFRDPVRSPMQWDSSANAGFNKGKPTWLPVNPNYEVLNVKEQHKNSHSTLHILKEMIKLKHTSAFKAFKEDGAFEYKALSVQVFQIVRRNNVNEEYRVLTNFGDQIEYFDGLTNKTMEYVILNSYSPHKKGKKVDLSKRIYLEPFEGVVLRWYS